MSPAASSSTFDLAQLEIEHRQIHRRADRIRAAIEAGSEADVRAGLHFLERYLKQHFQREERWMEARGYPALLEHARLHASLLAKLEDARRALELVGVSAHAVKAIVGDLDGHLTQADPKLVRFHVARESLRKLAGADGLPARATPAP